MSFAIEPSHEEMESNINLSKWGKIQNQEFRKQKIYYGYSVFRFGDHIGIILKNITETSLSGMKRGLKSQIEQSSNGQSGFRS